MNRLARLLFAGGETWTLTLNVDAECFTRTDEAIEVFGFFAQGNGGFGRGFGGNSQTMNGTITLTDSGKEDGDKIAENLDLKIVEIHGGMFNRRPAGNRSANTRRPSNADSPANGRPPGAAEEPVKNLIMEWLDAARNGKISTDELEKATDRLKALDRSKDGELTEEELQISGTGRAMQGNR